MQFYSPGQGTLICLPNTVVFLPEGLTAARVTKLWELLLAAKDNLVSTLDIVTTHLDPSLETLPDFVVIQFEPCIQGPGITGRDIRVACRGTTAVEVRTAGAPAQLLTGAQASMWRETAHTAATSITVGAPQRATFPLLTGCVNSAGFSWSGEDQVMVNTALGVMANLAPEAQATAGSQEITDLGATLTELPQDWVPEKPEPVIAPQELPQPPRSTAPQLPPTQVMGAPVSNQPAPAAVYFGSVHFSHGQNLELGPPIVVGRNPSIQGSGAQPGAVLVPVPSPEKDVSRNHLGIHIDQGYVVATDLNSVNGTVLKRAGHPDRKLNPSEGTLILAGDLVDLGDGVVLTFTGIT